MSRIDLSGFCVKLNLGTGVANTTGLASVHHCLSEPRKKRLDRIGLATFLTHGKRLVPVKHAGLQSKHSFPPPFTITHFFLLCPPPPSLTGPVQRRQRHISSFLFVPHLFHPIFWSIFDRHLVSCIIFPARWRTSITSLLCGMSTTYSFIIPSTSLNTLI